jgi:hypothetical protein
MGDVVLVGSLAGQWVAELYSGEAGEREEDKLRVRDEASQNRISVVGLIKLDYLAGKKRQTIY